MSRWTWKPSSAKSSTPTSPPSGCWRMARASALGPSDQAVVTEPTDCPWERWRNAGQQTGVTVRMNLRYQVADALRSLGTGS